MKTLKQFLKEDSRNVPLIYKDWLIHISNHFLDRIELRRGFRDLSHVISMLEKTADKIDEKYQGRLPSDVFVKYRHNRKGCVFTAIAENRGDGAIRQHMPYDMSKNIKKGIVGVTSLGCRDRGYPEPNRRNKEIIINVREELDMVKRKIRTIEELLRMYAQEKGLDTFVVRSIDNHYYMYDQGVVNEVEDISTINEDILIEGEDENDWCLFESENYFDDDEEPIVIEV